MFRLLNLVLLLSPLSGAGSFVLASHTLRNSTDPNTSAIESSKLPYIESQATSSISPSVHQSVSFTNVPTPLPYPLDSYDPGGLQNWQDLTLGNCTVQDQFCSYEGFNTIIGNASIAAFANQCLLWDDSCVGNRTLAIEEFFNVTEGDILNNRCFSNYDSGNAGIALPEIPVGENAASGTGQLVVEDAGNSSDCKTYNPPERLSAWKRIKSWMRSPGCISAQEEWVKMGGQIGGDDYGPSNASQSCCAPCIIGAQNVDLYYWPEPDVDTSCLSTIGNSVHPFGFGATTAGLTPLNIYWACTAKTPVTSTDTWTSINAGGILTTMTTVPMITTAVVDVIGSISVKVPLINPWASSPCIEIDTTHWDSNSSNSSAKNQTNHASIQARDHTLLVPSHITQGNNLTISTVVIGNFTFTSPSIYANFYNIQASDTCGQTTMSTTMLSFSPGELSTVEGPLRIDNIIQSTRRFDFRDLPCPPQSIMEANWYKPEPGEPYRPLIAMPSQLKEKIPWFSLCSNVFTAYDPPHALSAVTAFGPGPTPGRQAGPQPPTPAPSATLDPGARKTAGAVPVARVTDDPAVRRPKATIGPVPLPKLGNPNPAPSHANKESDGKEAGDPKHGSDSSGDPSQGDKSEEGSDPRKGSGNSDDPGQGNKSGEGNDPKQDSGNSGDPSQNNKSSSDNDPKQGSANSGDSSQGSNTKGSSDPINDGDTGRDPSHNNDAQKSSGTSVNLGGQVDSNLPGLPFRPTVAVNGDQETSPLAGLVVPDESNHIDLSNAVGGGSERNSLGGSANDVPNTLVPPGTQRLNLGTPTDSSTSPKINSIVTTIAGQAITAAPTAITIPGTIIKQGDPGVTLRGTPVALDTAGQLVVDSKTIPIPPGPNSEPFTTTVGGRTIAASAVGIAIAGTTLGPGDAGESVDGTLLSLDTAGHFVVGSKTQTFESESASLGAVTAGNSGPGGQSTPVSTTPAGNVANETVRGNGTVTGVQPFKGKAEDFFRGLRMRKGVAIFVAVILAFLV